MNELSITCPSCSTKIPLTEALAAPFLDSERRKVEAEVSKRLVAEQQALVAQAKAEAAVAMNVRLKEHEAALAERDAKLEAAREAELKARKSQEQADQAKRDIELTVQRRVDTEREAISKKAVADTEAAMQARIKAGEAVIAEKDAQIRAAQTAEMATRKALQDAEQAKREVELTVQRQVDEAKQAVAAAAAQKATAELAPKLRDAERALAEKDAKLQVAQQAEIEARRLRQEAEDAKRETELTVQRRLDQERASVRQAAMKERDDEHRLQLAEKDKQLADMRQQIEEARRKGSIGSQQLAGDVLEVDLHDILQARFPADRVERVKKGQRGGDVLHTVVSASGIECGAILWETKRTKAWSEGWLGKARDDQREVKADLVAIASEAMPDDLSPFGEREKVWVTSIPTVIPVASALRHALIETAVARRAGAMADTARDQVFAYLASPQFRQRVSRIAEAYKDMREALDTEKRSTARTWAAREKQLDRVIGGLAGLYGDLQGIAGASLPVIEQLALPQADDTASSPRLVAGSDVKPDNGGRED